MMKIRTAANGMIYWGTKPLVAGAKCLGVVEVNGKSGALIKSSKGDYYFGKEGKLLPISNEEVQKRLVLSEIGKVKSPKKAAASAENGKKGGGRPRSTNPVRRRPYHDKENK